MKSYVFHHNDDDGKCAAFLVKQYLINPMEPLTTENFIEYNYTGNLDKKTPEIEEGDVVYIVDLCLDEDILKLIRMCVEKKVTVLHIDHHHTGIELYNERKSELDSYSNYYTPFLKEGISGTMLTWIYANVFNDTDKLHPMIARFDFDDDKLRNTCCRIDEVGNPIDSNDMPITTDRNIEHIPDVVRMIDDNDLWKHAITDTRYFSAGFQLCKDKHPLNHIWIELLDEGDVRQKNEVLTTMLNNGVTIINYRSILDARNLRNGFMLNFDGKYVVFLNTPDGNSSIFQEMYDHADAVCKYSFDGTRWTYTFYSKNDGADVSKIIESLKNDWGEECGFLTGGGHVHAAGCSFTFNFLDKMNIDKKLYVDFRKEIRVEIELAKEKEMAAELERQKREQDEKLAKLRAKVLGKLEEDEEDYGI